MLTPLVVALSFSLQNPSRSPVGKRCAPAPTRRAASFGEEAEVNTTRPAPLGLAKRSVGWRCALIVVKPETVIAWHRKGFRLFWTWKVRHGQPGRPSVLKDVRDLIRLMSRANPTWGAPRIHGELLKLGIDIGERSVNKDMVRHQKLPSQTWHTFLENHVKNLVSVDFFTVPTLRFQVLYGLLA